MSIPSFGPGAKPVAGAPAAPPSPQVVRPEPTPDWAVGWVYLFCTTIGYEKIGFSVYPERRIRENTQLPFEVWIEHAFPVGTRNVERRLHGFFEPRRVRGEWFSLGADGIELVRSITAAQSTASLPPAFRASRFTAPLSPMVRASVMDAAGSFGDRLTALRTSLSLTVEQLAHRSSLSPWLIRALETDPTADVVWPAVVALAKGLSVPTDAFLAEGGAT